MLAGLNLQFAAKPELEMGPTGGSFVQRCQRANTRGGHASSATGGVGCATLPGSPWRGALGLGSSPGTPQDETLQDVPAPLLHSFLKDASLLCCVSIRSLCVTGRGASGAGPSASQPLVSLAAALGTLDFSLLYDQENNALHCTINKAKVRGAGQPVG